MPPRDFLSRTHKEDPEKELEPGCLWETFVRQAEQQEPDGFEDDDASSHEENEIIMAEFIRPVAPPYINVREEYGDTLQPLLDNIAIIQEEARQIPLWTAWPEQAHYSSPESWTVFPLCYCFPAHDVSRLRWIPKTSSLVPRTVQMLQCIPQLRTALFSRLAPETTLTAHTGWSDLANHVYRLHLPLVVPGDNGSSIDGIDGDVDDGKHLCGTWVDGCVETHAVGRFVAFDDSKVHRAFNYSKEERVVLILDVIRPEGLPKGTATGGHTEELDAYIQQMT